MRRKIALIALLPVLAVCFSAAPQARTDRPFGIVAHRGVKKFAPENTLPAIQKAIDMGLDYVEMDVRETKDGEIILMHNSTVDGTTNGTGAVADLTLEEIRSLDAGSKFSKEFAGARVPLFREALALMKGKIKIYLDFKAGPPEKVIGLIEEYEMVDSVVVYDDPASLAKIKELNPKIALMPHADNIEQLKLLKKTLGNTCVETSINKVDKEFVEEAHKLGIRVFADLLGPLDGRTGLIAAAKMKIDVVQTDNADVLLDVLEKREKRKERVSDDG